MSTSAGLLTVLTIIASSILLANGRGLMQASAPAVSPALAQLPLPLAKVHSHNDYDQPRPLFAALEAGICSIEADPWLINGTFYVAHDATAIRKNLTIQSLYLDPLSKIVKANGGQVYPASEYSGICNSIILLVDFKSTAFFLPNGTGAPDIPTNSTGQTMWDLFEQLLASYQAQTPGLFTTWYGNGTLTPGAINVYISGTRPDPSYVVTKRVRYSALDGRLVNLDNAYGPDVFPLVSQGWCCGPGTVATWVPADSNTTIGNITTAQVNYVKGLVKQAHDQDRIIRFWATPDTPEAWAFFYASGEDLVNTDFLQPLRSFTLAQLAGSKSAMAGVPGLQLATA